LDIHTFTFFNCRFFILFKDYRTPSKKRLETISDIQLPNKFKVLQDKFHSDWQDYHIIYEIKFEDNSTLELINRIKASKFYTPNVNQKIISPRLSFHAEDEYAIWSKDENKYYFVGQKQRTMYSIELDTSTNILKYVESAD